ncbi:MAG: hypothetical protein R3324_12545 [Halobacteriales archaeon]|nr:hypothetical protein [Halobacteriales archaeon]
MSGFHRAGLERVNAFPIGERYLFKHYFEGRGVFDRLREYYNNQQYRFEVPAPDFEDLQAFLANEGYALVEVETPEAFAVVVRQYTAHPDNIFKDSVLHRPVGDYNCFLMTDREAVDRAVDEGARRLTATDLERPF